MSVNCDFFRLRRTKIVSLNFTLPPCSVLLKTYKPQNFPPAAGHTPSNIQFILRASTTYSSIFQIYKRLSWSLHMRKTFLQIYVGAMRLYLRAATVLSTQSHAQNESNSYWYAAEILSYSRAQNACKKICFVTKMHRRRDKNEIQELKRSFLM